MNLTRIVLRRAGPWIRRGDAANRAGDWESARRAYAIALAIRPGLSDIRVQYGHALGQLGHVRPAIRAYRQAAAARPDDAAIRAHLAHAQLRAGDREAALVTFRAALALGADDAATTDAIARLTAETDPARIELVVRAQAHGARSDLLPFFDWEYYLFANRLVGPDATPTALDALDHLFATGIDGLLPAHERWGFDAAYYRRRYRTGRRPAAALYRDWIERGIGRGRSPNLVHELETRLAATGLDRALVARVLGRHAALATRDPAAAAARFVRAVTGAVPAFVRDPGLLDADSAAFFSRIADTLHLRGRRAAATAHREALLARRSGDARTRQHLADALLDADRPRAAAPHYRRLIADDTATGWTYLNLARCCQLLDDEEGDLATIEAAVRRFPVDRGFVRELDAAQDRAFARVWDDALALPEGRPIAPVQTAIADVCARIAPAPGARAIAPRIAGARRTVALVANEALEQCRLYRVEQKIEQLRAAGCTVEKFNSDRELDAFVAGIDRFDVAIFYRVPALPAMMRAIRAANVAGLATVYEVDDLIFDPAHYPSPLAGYGGLVAHAEHVGLAAGVPLFRHAMALCDHALASTPALADQMAPVVRSGRAFVHRNALGEKHVRAIAAVPPARDDSVVTILYGSGTKAHKEDFTELLEPALIEIARRHANVRIVLVGYRAVGPALAALGERLVLIDPIADVQTYWRVLGEADINLAVLKPSTMADCKSEIKWLEAAMLGIPSIVSATRTYAEIVRDGETGFLCETAADWTDALDRLVRDPALRARIGAAARDDALAGYGEPAMAANIAAIVDDVMPPAVPPRRRVAVVNVYYPPQAIGGATRVVHDNVRAIATRHGDRLDIEVFASIDGEQEPYRTVRQIVDDVRVTGVTTPDDPLVDRRTHDRRMGELFGEFLDVARVDLIHFHCVQRLTADLLEVAARRGIPYVVTAHDGWWISDEQFLVDRHDRIALYDYALPPTARQHALGAPAFRRMGAIEDALIGARRVLPVSEPFADLYRAAGVAGVHTIANGVSDLPERHRTTPPDHRLRLAHIGGASRHKGYHLVRQALWTGDYRNLHLTVIDHAMAPGTSRRERWGTTPVTLLPRVDQSAVAGLYHATDILLAPSIWPESHGLVTREALASGCWVIASDRGAIGAEVTDGANGHIVDVGSAAALARLLARIDADPDRYRAMPALLPAFRTADAQADELAALYLELIAEAGGTLG